MREESSNDGVIPRCKICKEEVHAGATKCIHCGCYQRRRLLHAFSQSTQVTMALVAAISSSSVLITLWQDNLAPQKDDIHVQLINADAEKQQVNLLVANLGKRAGAIGGVRIISPPKLIPITMIPGWSLTLPENTVIAPEEARNFTLQSPKIPVPRQAEPTDPAETYKIEVDIIHFGGRDETITLEYKGEWGTPTS